jgi:putative transposase
VGNSPELVRKRAGSKAFEYHIDCLPEQAREIVKARHYREVLKQSDCSSAPTAPKREVTTTRDELALLRQCPVLLNVKSPTLPNARNRSPMPAHY